MSHGAEPTLRLLGAPPRSEERLERARRADPQPHAGEHCPPLPLSVLPEFTLEGSYEGGRRGKCGTARPR